MKLRDMIEQMSIAQRKAEVDASDRLQLGEIILKLEAVENKSLPIVFDIPGAIPKGIGSWRGIYAELAIYTEELGSIQTGEVKHYERGSYYESEPIGKENPTTQERIDIMKRCVGAQFTGYKGGDFKMNKNTPVSICKHTNECSWTYDEEKDDYANTFIVEVMETPECNVFITGRE